MASWLGFRAFLPAMLSSLGLLAFTPLCFSCIPISLFFILLWWILYRCLVVLLPRSDSQFVFFHVSLLSVLIRLDDSFQYCILMFCSCCLSLFFRHRGPPAPWGSGSQSCLSGTGSSKLGSLKGGPTASGWQASSTRRASWQPWDRYTQHQATYPLTHRQGGYQMARRGRARHTATFTHTHTHKHTCACALTLLRQTTTYTHFSLCFLINSNFY